MSLELWDKLKTPPKEALTEITAGRLKGKNDINPVWRYRALTEVIGPCGVDWKYEVVKEWTQEAPDNQLLLFMQINFYYKHNGEWSAAIPSFGGDTILVKESRGIYLNDEAYGMALTDAIGKAMKMIGVAADVYFNKITDSKYSKEQHTTEQQEKKDKPAQKEFECSECKEKINEATYNYSLKNYDKHLCRKCQGNYTKKKSA